MKFEEKIIRAGKMIAIIAIVILLSVSICATALAKDSETVTTQKSNTEGKYYALTTLVVEIDRESDTVTCIDSTGNAWQFYGAEDWQEGDCASLLMWDNGTSNITDDEIHSARYNAWGLTE